MLLFLCGVCEYFYERGKARWGGGDVCVWCVWFVVVFGVCVLRKRNVIFVLVIYLSISFACARVYVCPFVHACVCM